MTQEDAETDRQEDPSQTAETRPSKKRKLKPPGEAFKPSLGPAVNVSRHQGRKRAQPHVDGQWSTHIYLDLTPSQALLSTLREAVEQARLTLSSSHGLEVHSMLVTESEKAETLHLSLSRPIQLWTGQRTAFLAACRAALASLHSFEVTLATFDVLTNDERTRSFLVCEVGFGYNQLNELTTAVNNILKVKHLPTYYAEPRFHVSIGWWLHDEEKMLSEKDLAQINASHGEAIRKPVLVVANVKVKFGKDVSTIDLLQ